MLVQTPAEAHEGGKMSIFGDHATGKFLQLVPGRLTGYLLPNI
jgi:hypothetical protein